VSRQVMFVGSVPLANSAAVFKEVGSRCQNCAPRIPDGETGERLGWVGFQYRRLRQVDGLEEFVAYTTQGAVQQEIPRFKFAAGRDKSNVDVGHLGYDQYAAQSYEAFKRARASGDVAEGVRFQVSLPTPYPLSLAVEAGIDEVMPLFEAALVEDIKGLLSKIPAEDLAIQWDIAAEVVELEARKQRDDEVRIPRNPSFTLDAAVDAIERASKVIPPEVELGVHLCFGDDGGTHMLQPVDISTPVAVANVLAERLSRPLTYVHMPVPIARDDEEYFAPLEALKLKPGTKLFLGLVHPKDGVAGAARRIEAAKRFAPDFGVATECGLGRLPPETIPAVLDLHTAIARL
jgi:hypothetical protein